MKSAVSSKGTFLPSEVPWNRVQKLILNITTTTVWQGERCTYHNYSSTPWICMPRLTHLPHTTCVKTTQLHILLQNQEWRSARRKHLMQFIHALWIDGPAIIPLSLLRKNRLKLHALEVERYHFLQLTLMGFPNSQYANSLPSNKSCWDSPLANRRDATGLVMLLEK